MTPEHIALLRQQQVLIAQLADIYVRLDAVNKALFPKVDKKRPKKFDAKKWSQSLDKRMGEKSQ